MALLFLYTSWLPFLLLLPWGRRSPALWSWLPVGAGVTASAYALVTFSVWPQANIRVDLLLALLVVFACDAVGWLVVAITLLSGRRRRALTSTARLMATTACVAVGAWLAVGIGGLVESRRTHRETVARFRHGQALLLEAKLRNRGNALIAYGPLESSDAWLARWVGVWDLEATAVRIRSLVVTGDREVWVRFDCNVPECEAGPGTLERSDEDRAIANVRGLGGGGWELALGGASPDSISVRARSLTGGDPVLAEAQRRMLEEVPDQVQGELVALGTHSVLEWLPSHVALTEVRLWRQERKIYGVALCQVVVPGRSTMLMPKLFEAELQPDDSFPLQVSRCGGLMQLLPQGLTLTGRDPRDWRAERTVRLEPRAVVRDPGLDLTPSTSVEAWRDWTEAAVRPVIRWNAPTQDPTTSPPSEG